MLCVEKTRTKRKNDGVRGNTGISKVNNAVSLGESPRDVNALVIKNNKSDKRKFG
jgi:hypothetical protein